jgi:hypothetical protein
MSSLSLALQAYSEFLSNFYDGNRLRCNFLQNSLWFDGWRVGHIPRPGYRLTGLQLWIVHLGLFVLLCLCNNLVRLIAKLSGKFPVTVQHFFLR